MNGVLGMMEVLEHQGLDPEQRRTVATMRESAQALLRIIDDVLDFSKIEAGRLDLEKTAFSLSGLVEGVARTLTPQTEAKGLRSRQRSGRVRKMAYWRPDAGADPVQSTEQRHQVHRCRRGPGPR
jgi:signal transduction histidine kinase